MISAHLAQGQLVILLEGWSCTLPGVFLYHPSRRQPPMPLQVFLRFIEKRRKHASETNRAISPAKRSPSTAA
jgi:DNA-binding transcriptional LysR family regulator